jgi:CRISPR-associated protein Cmr2
MTNNSSNASAVLVFSVGPVQDFIATARRTQDLWMGSYILSYLTGTGLAALAKQHGMDAVIFPLLSEQPLIRFWLSQTPGDLSLPSLSNKFTAIMPVAQIESTVNDVQAAIKREWRNMSHAVNTAFMKWGDKPDETWNAIWDRQVDPDALLEMYWAWRQLADDYAEIYASAERGFNARKNLRDFMPLEEAGEKCTLCGQRQALYTGNDHSLRAVRAYWNNVQTSLEQAEYYTALKRNGAERLCAVCAVKRFAQGEYLKHLIQLPKEAFPSTGSVAVADFVGAILPKLSGNDQIQQSARNLVWALRKRDSQNQCLPSTAQGAIPHLEEQVDRLPEDWREIGKDLTAYDGEFYFAETYTLDRFRDYRVEVSEAQIRDMAAKRTALVEAAKQSEIRPPAKYYAVLAMDGDKMGEWISGTHTNFRTLSPDGQVSPDVHRTISQALSAFALERVRQIVEQAHAGRVVYAGGDDVLALLPLSNVLETADQLRQAFSEALPGATASVGIAVAHHNSPLSEALAAARHTERAAKDSYGRNALAVTFLKRSGEVLRVGAQWRYSDELDDVAAVLDEMQQAIANEQLSSKFAHAYWESARALPAAAVQAELCRLIKRHKGGNAPDKDELDQWASVLSRRWAALAQHLQDHRQHWEKNWGKYHNRRPDPVDEDEAPQPGALELSQWLLLAHFLALGGEE